MKQFILLLLSWNLLITACGQTSPLTQPTPASITDNPATTSSPLPTATQTAFPTITATASITPLPTIPTFTPTFDVRTIVTVTPALKAECPKEDPSVVAKFATPDSYVSYEIYSTSEILDYLNSGGTLDRLQDSGLDEIADITGDGLHEVVYKSFGYSFFGCKDGQYQDLFDFAGDFGVELADVLDLNKNGIPEITLYDIVHYGYTDVFVFEWDGNKFRSLIDVGTNTSTGLVTVIDHVSATSPHKITDINRDGLKEIVVVYDVNRLCGGFGDFCDGTPTREQTTILGWNGQNYVVKQRNYAPAQYRFQAIQDGDTASSQKEYDKALSLYQEAISNDKLKGYSQEIRDNLRAQWDASFGTTPTPTPYPVASDEYTRLAAYAYYRIMLLHLVQGNESDATIVYTTLQEKFGNDPYGQPYAEMATAFWEAYQSTHKMYDGCAAAIQYAAEHPEILILLGSDYHGWQSKIYEPEDVCPFR